MRLATKTKSSCKLHMDCLTLLQARTGTLDDWKMVNSELELGCLTSLQMLVVKGHTRAA